MSTDHPSHRTSHSKQPETHSKAELQKESTTPFMADVLADSFDEHLLNKESESIESLKQQVAELRAQNAEIQEKVDENWRKMLDMAAEHDNEKKRHHRNAEQKEKFAIERLTRDLLPILDSLVRAAESAHALTQQANSAESSTSQPAIHAMQEGLILTIKMFEDTLAKHHVEIVDPQGVPFDPQYHEAMSMTTNPELADNFVVSVIQKGYLLHGRLVRPARVIVNKRT